MLGKLLKYEIKATARLFIPAYAVVLMLAAVNRLQGFLTAGGNRDGFSLRGFLGTTSVVLYVSLVVAVFVMTLVIMIQRFYKNLLGDEGYLMFTIPVTVWEHISSKLLVSLMWIFLSAFTVFCSVFILVNPVDVLKTLSGIIDSARRYIGDSGILVIMAYLLITVVTFIAEIYGAIAVGHLSNRHKVLASFGAYIAIYIIGQAVYSLYMAIFLASNSDMIYNGSMMGVEVNSVQYTELFGVQAQLVSFMLPITLINAALAAANFMLTEYILRKRLNLE